MEIFAHGRMIAGLKIVRLLGRGAFADVYEVEAPGNKRRALKILRDDAPEKSRPRERIAVESEAVGTIEHVNALAFHGAGEDDGYVWILLELVEGSDLARLSREAGGALPIERVVSILRQVCEGVDAAHKVGILHRDLKPENILVTGDDLAKVGDFGSARLSAQWVKTTKAQDISSSLYMAPEFMTRHKAEAKSDVYSIGVILYELLAGAHPFAPGPASPMQIVDRHLHHEPKSLDSLGRGVPGDLSDLVKRAMAKDPVARCTMRALADGLAEVLKPLRAHRRAAARALVLPGGALGYARTEPGLSAVGPSGTMVMAAVGGGVAGDARAAAPAGEREAAAAGAGGAAEGREGGRVATVPPAPLPSTLRSPTMRRAAPVTVSMPEAGAMVERRTTAVQVVGAAGRASAAGEGGSRRGMWWAVGVGVAVLGVGLAVVGWLLGGSGGGTAASGPPAPASVTTAAAPAMAAPAASGSARSAPPGRVTPRPKH